MTCERTHLDGAYVLGALAPSERLDFEQHLVSCAECSTAVRDLAGLPGLLAQVDVSDLEPVRTPPLPPTLLPALVREVRGSQRRRSALVAAVAASVAAVAVGALAAGGAFEGSSAPAASPPAVSTTSPGRPMLVVGQSPVRAEVVIDSVAWGSRLDLSCSYSPETQGYAASPASPYALVLRTREGRSEQVATWHGLPGRTMHLTAATATRRSDIESVEMRTGDGVVVLRLPI